MEKTQKITRLSPATKAFRCTVCNAAVQKKASWIRHMLVQHRIHPDGSPADPGRVERYTAYGWNTQADKKKRVAALTQATTEGAPDEPSIQDTTTSRRGTMDNPAKPKAKGKSRRPIPDEVSSYPEPANGPDDEISNLEGMPLDMQPAPTVKQNQPEESSSTARKPVKRKVVEPTPGSSREPDLSTEACIRRPTRPPQPGICHQIRWLQTPIFPVPKRTTPPPSLPARRRVLTPKMLAKFVSRRPHLKPDAVVDELAKRFTLNPDQRRTTVNQVKAMRAMHRRVVADIRKELPVQRVIRDIDAFLDNLATKMEEISTSDSADEFE